MNEWIAVWGRVSYLSNAEIPQSINYLYVDGD